MKESSMQGYSLKRDAEQNAASVQAWHGYVTVNISTFKSNLQQSTVKSLQFHNIMYELQ
jgi:hypothetical protein